MHPSSSPWKWQARRALALAAAAVVLTACGQAPHGAATGGPPPPRASRASTSSNAIPRIATVATSDTPRVEAALPVLAGQAAAPGARLRIATYNIEEFTDGQGDAPERSALIADRHARMAAAILDEADADVVVIQEVENAAMLSLLNRKLKKPYPIAYVTRFADGTRINEKMNAGVLSRVTIENPTELDFAVLSLDPRPARGLLRFEVPLEDARRLLVYTGHLKSNYGEKERNIAQRTAALRLLREDCARVTAAAPGAYEVIFLGDTNVDPDLPSFASDPSFAPLEGWKDLWRGIPIDQRTTVPLRREITGAATPPAACFDRIFVSPELTQAPWTTGTPRAIAKGVDQEDVGMPPGFGDHVSDHYPVYVDLTR